MKYKIILAFLISLSFSSFSQDLKSKGDKLFYEYKYTSAIAEYIKEQQNGALTNFQLLNLADAYFKTGEYENASELYLEINKNDTIMSVHRFNKMLQSLSKSDKKERIKTFLRSKSPVLATELMENADFNYLLLESENANSNVITKLKANSPQGDFSPAFYKDGLLFSSGRTQNSKEVYEPTGESYLDIYFGELDVNGQLLNVEPFDEIPNSSFHRSTPYYSSYFCTFYYILSNTEQGQLAYDENGKNALAIGAFMEDGQFSFLLKDLSTSFYYPFFDDKTERLFFAANFDDSYGGTDLYYVYTNNGQIMSAPVNLGPRINSPGNEISPYIFNDELYFSSDVFYGLGGMDVYKSTIIAEDTYTIPINLGKGINSVEDDFGLIIKEDGPINGYTGYFASNRNGGLGGDDLYKFRMDNIPGLKTFTLTGAVVDFNSKRGVYKAQILVLNSNGKVIKEVYSGDDGEFRIEVPWQSQLTVQATKEDYSFFSMSYTEEQMEVVQNDEYSIGLFKMEDLIKEEEGKKVVKLDKFYFDKGEAVVTSPIATQLNKVVDAMAQFPQIRLKIETHTDSRGSNTYNKNLSQERSNAIKAYLLEKGLPSSIIIEAVGYGEESIKNNCVNGAYCLDFLHKQNERTLIVVE